MSNMNPPTVAPNAEQFEELGVLHVKSLLSTEEIAEIRDVFMDQIVHDRSVGNDDHVPDDDPLALFPRIVQPHRRPDLQIGKLSRQWMLDPRIIGRVMELMGAVYAAQSMFYFKPPTARGQALHQDNMFLQAHPETCLAVWIAVDDCDGENGGLKVVPGSHKYELVCPEEADQLESFTKEQIRLPDGMVAEQTELKAGDAMLFHGSLAHGSGPNRSSDRFRRSLIFHYVPQSSKEIARFYNPVLTPSGDEIYVAESIDGGACGEGWLPAGPH